jgi:hypothetical protein
MPAYEIKKTDGKWRNTGRKKHNLLSDGFASLPTSTGFYTERFSGDNLWLAESIGN